MSARRMEIVIPGRIWEILETIERMKGIKKEDLLMRALIKVIEEFGGGRVT